jgi:hypothetical protein
MFLIFPPPVANVISTVVETLYDIVTSLCDNNMQHMGGFINEAKSAMKCTGGNLDNKGKSEALRELKDLNYIHDTTSWPIPIRNWKAREDYRTNSEVNWEHKTRIGSLLDIWKVTELGPSVKIERKKKYCEEVAILQKMHVDELGNITIEPGADIGFPSIDLKELLSEENIKGKIEEQVKALDPYVYDVELPNGKFIYGLNEEDLEEFTYKYNVIYSSNTKYNIADTSDKPIILK